MTVSSFWPKLIVSGSSAEQPSPASPKASMPRDDSLREQREDDKSERHHKRQEPVGTGLGEPLFDDGEEHRPTVTIAQNTVSASDATVVLAPETLRHVERCPVAVHRLDDAVEQGKRGKDPEAGGKRRLALRRFARRGPCAPSSRAGAG